VILWALILELQLRSLNDVTAVVPIRLRVIEAAPLPRLVVCGRRYFSQLVLGLLVDILIPM